MKWKTLSDTGERTWALIFDKGDEPISLLTRFAEEQGLSAASFTAIGAFSEAVTGYFDWEKKDYVRNPIREQVEVLSLMGDVALSQKKPKVHAHVVLGKRDGTAHGGHLLEARVRPTLEVVLTETPARLVRKHDPETGLALIRI